MHVTFLWKYHSFSLNHLVLWFETAFLSSIASRALSFALLDFYHFYLGEFLVLTWALQSRNRTSTAVRQIRRHLPGKIYRFPLLNAQAGFDVWSRDLTYLCESFCLVYNHCTCTWLPTLVLRILHRSLNL
jgi:hypothetical protein